MGDVTDIDRAEFDSLRTESLFHQTNASAVFGLNIVGLGVGITAASQFGAALLVLGVLSCVLWFRYCDHLMAIFRIAAYLHGELRPRMSARLGEPVLSWELFIRSIETPDGTRMPALPSRDSRIGLIAGSLAFILPPPLLCAAFIVQRLPVSGGGRGLVIVAVVFVLLIWGYALVRGYRALRWIHTTDTWLMSR
jgi:hypothetical protein